MRLMAACKERCTPRLTDVAIVALLIGQSGADNLVTVGAISLICLVAGLTVLGKQRTIAREARNRLEHARLRVDRYFSSECACEGPAVRYEGRDESGLPAPQGPGLGAVPR